MTEKLFRELVAALAAAGHDTEWHDDWALVTPPDGSFAFALQREGAWLQVVTNVLEPGDVKDAAHRNVLNELLLRVHGHFLGCRFGYVDDGSVDVAHDLYPGTATLEHVAPVMSHLDFVASALVPLMEAALAKGALPSDAAIDRAFEAA